MKKILLIILLSISLVPTISFADSYKLLEPLPCIDGVGGCTKGEMQREIDLNSYILYVYKFSIAIAVFLAIVMIIWGGFLTMTSEIPYIKSDGKSKIQNAVTGLAMVLVSYLILATIDPRLVNIDSNITPIKIDPKELAALRDFQGELVSDLRDVSAENQIKFQEIDSRIKELEKEKAGIIAGGERGENLEEDGIPIDQIEWADKNITPIDKQIEALKIDKVVLAAEDRGASSYATALTNIETSNILLYTATPLPETTGTKSRPTNSPNVIQNQYNEKINTILSTSNSSMDKVQALEKQRDFYIEQIKEDAKIYETINSNWALKSVSETTKLKEKVTLYTNNLKDESVIKKSGLSPEQYSKIMNAKIEVINQALNKTNP